jgi:hypothetical protein
MSADYPAAQEHFVPRNFMFNSNSHSAIIIHKTGGDATPQAVYNTFINSGNPGKSSHYAIGTDGAIWQFVPEALGAGANGITDSTTDPFWYPYMQQYGNLNTCTISIEHCDASSANDTPLTTAQKQASFALVAHRSICATTCPGTYPMTELIAYVQQGGNTPMVPTGWKDDGHTLTAPNGHRVVLGFRDYVLSHNWDAHNQPLEEEWTADPLEVSNPSLGAGQKQSFVWTTLEYTPARGVFEAWQGQELVALRVEIAALKTATPPPVPVDTTQAIAAVNAIADQVATAVASAAAAAVVVIKKLS